MSWNKGILFTLMLASAVFFGACAQDIEPSNLLLQENLLTTDEITYYTVPVEVDTYETVVTGAAKTVYPLQQDLYLENSNAFYKEVLVKTGQKVKEGDILMTFDIAGSSAELESLKLKIQRKIEDTNDASAEMLAVINHKKIQAQELKNEKLLIEELQIEKLEAAYQQFQYETELEITDLRQRIEEIEAEGRDNVLVAPFDGIIDSVATFDVGDNVIPGTKLISMHSADKVLLETRSTVHELRYHMPVTITVSNRTAEQTFTGRVITAPNILPRSVNSENILIALDESVTEDQLTGTIKFSAVVEKVQNVLVVDADAVHAENNKYYVNLLEDNVLKKRYVTIFNNTRADKVWILDGLSEGQQVVID